MPTSSMVIVRGGARGETVARNEHDGRSLEERLASLDAMSNQVAEPSSPAESVPGDPASGESSPEAPGPGAAEPVAESAPPAGDPAGEGAPPAGEASEGSAPADPEATRSAEGPAGPGNEPASGQPPPAPPANPWLAAPPPPGADPGGASQPEGFPPYGEMPQHGAPPPPPFQSNPPAQQLYDGGPMPQPFDGGMLPSPYEASQPPFQAAQPSDHPLRQPRCDASPPNDQQAPPLDQLPPYPTEQPGPAAPQQGGPPPGPPGEGQFGMPSYDPHANPGPGFGPAEYQRYQDYQQYQQGPQEAHGHYMPGPPPHGYPQGPMQPGPQGAPGAPAHPGHPAQHGPPPPQGSESLSSENLLGERRIAPSFGWRRAVYKATAGSIHPGESQAELRRKDLIARARTPVADGHYRVAVMSLKGGVGKTTTTVGLGSMLASLRGDRVIAVDANPDRGTLSDKLKLETAATVRDLLNNRDQVHRYADVRAFTSQNAARLEVLASDRDPAVSEAFSAEDYSAVAVVLEQFYSICITDCGTGLLHSAMAGVLSLADQLVLVSSPSVDGARSASATLDWLEAHDHGHLVRSGVVVLSMVRNRTRSQVDLDKLQAHFESRCRGVVRIPYDDHLEEGAEVELEQLAPPTREAYLSLAAMIGDGFAIQREQR
jgi:MinD-like ATPase involved in chromosome partitioning or flagellar assembly